MILVTDAEGLEKVNALLNTGLGAIMFQPEDPNHVFDVTGLDDLGYQFYLCDGGVFIAEPLSGDDYRGHSGFLPDKQGFHAVVEHRKVLRHFFTSTHGTRLVCSVNSQRAERNVRGLGFTVMDAVVKIATLDYLTWAHHDRSCKAAGAAFKRVFPDAHSELLQHLGAFAETLRAGLPHKAVVMFNDYAALMGLGTMFLGKHNNEFIFCGKSFRITHNDVVGV